MLKKMVGLLIAGVLMCGTLALASAQGGGQDLSQRRVTVKYDQADIRFVLKQLFDSVGANYSLDPNVQGNVTVSLTDVPFTVALDAILRQLDLTYRIESGVYYVTIRRPEEIPQTTTPTAPEEEGPRLNLPEKIQLSYANPYLIANLLGASIVGYSQYELSSGGGGGFGGFGGLGGGFGGFGGLGGGFGGLGGGFGGFGGGLGGGFGGFGGFGGGGLGGGGFGGFGGGGFRGGGGFGGGGFGGGGFGGGGFGGGFGR
ncbi:MAG: hypothetical protein SNJ72_00015 [Fimbriimonadales bacterium]